MWGKPLVEDILKEFPPNSYVGSGNSKTGISYRDFAVAVAFCRDAIIPNGRDNLTINPATIAEVLRLDEEKVNNAFEAYAQKGLVRPYEGRKYLIDRETLEALQRRVLDPKVLSQESIYLLLTGATKIVFNIIRYRLSELERRLEARTAQRQLALAVR